MAAIIDPMEQLQLIYQPLEGVLFAGSYQGEFTMPQTGNLRYTIQGDNLSNKLQQVSSAAIQTNRGTAIVWRGITGPPQYPHYWLWVEPDVGEVPVEGTTYNFLIEKCTPFPCVPDTDFQYGVSIKARIVQAVVPALPPLSSSSVPGLTG